MSKTLLSKPKGKLAAAAVVLLGLCLLPAPLLPPDQLAKAVHSMLGIGHKAGYLVAAIGLQGLFYGSLGVLAALAVDPAQTARRRLVQVLVLPLVIVGVVVAVRCVKLGHLPMLANAAVPLAACFLGVVVGLGVLYRTWKLALCITTAAIGLGLWGLLGGVPASLTQDTEARLQALVAASPGFPVGDARFGAIVQRAFAPLPANSVAGTEVQHNEAAILALGIAIGHERLAHFTGLARRGELVRKAVALRTGTTIRGRDDWARHYTLSAAIAVLHHPLLSDAGGLIKEQLDALTRGSGFSFGDLAANRAGVRFADAATDSETGARAMQMRLQNGWVLEDFFPSMSDLPEDLTVEEFRKAYGGVGSPHYRQMAAEIETRLDHCAAISAAQAAP